MTLLAPLRLWGMAIICTACGLACSTNVADRNDRAPGGLGTPPGSTSSVGSGSGGSPGGVSSTPGGATGGTGVPGATACTEGTPLAPARVWMLTDEQYVHVVKDVLGVALAGNDAQITAPTSTSGNYTNESEAFKVDTAAAQGYQRAAIKIASMAKPCGASVTAACVEQFVREQVARAWRRPLAENEIAGLLKIYNDYATVDGADSALSLVVQAVLQSPSFIYRRELGVNAATSTAPVAMNAHERASALSFLLLNSIPDDALWAKANDGTLSDNTVFAAEVGRLLALPAAQDQVSRLVGYWAGVEKIPSSAKDGELFPEYTAMLKASLYEGAQAFVHDVVWSGKFSDLLTSRKVYANDRLAAVYGLTGVMGAALVPVELPTTVPAAGLLTQPGILAATNKRLSLEDPIHRGLFIRNAFVCGGSIPAPPANAANVANTMMGTERELAQQRAALPTCAGCHALFDPLGLPLEQFDPIGRYRATDAKGVAIASDAILVGFGADLDGPVTGITDLAQRLTNGRRSADCSSKTLTKYAIGYSTQVESCDLTRAKDAFAQTGSFRTLFEKLLTSPAFGLRDIQLN